MTDGYETEELVRIEAALDALVSPTSEDVFQATRPFDERAIASVAATRAGNSGSSAFARVSLSALIDPWDGSPIPFDTVDVDSESLWDAVNHQFVAKTAGWYEIGAYDSGLDGGVGYPAVSLTNMLLLQVTIIGPGNNLGVTTQQHTGISSGDWWLPPLFGHTHLDPGDFAYIEGIGGGRVTAGFAFSLRLIAAD